MNLTPKVKRRAKIAAVYVGLIAFLFVSVPGAPAELIPTSPQSYLLAMSWDLAALFLFCLKIGVVIGLVLDSVQRLHHPPGGSSPRAGVGEEKPPAAKAARRCVEVS